MKAGRIALAVTFISIGPVHYLFRRFLGAIVPDALPAHRQLVVLSGAIATAEGVALLIPQTRRLAAWGMVLWLIAVYPANIWMAVAPERFRPIPVWMLWARLPFQFPAIGWAWLYTKRAEPAANQALLEPK
jgi:uncharacterized membrane protein